MSEPKLSRPLTETEQRAFDAAKYGPPPEQPKLVQLEPKRAGVFSLEDLAAAGSRCEYVPMPGGNGVWVHPLSVSEGIWVNRQVARELGRLGALTEQEGNVEIEHRLLVWVAVCACRQSEEPAAPRVFKESDAETLRTHPGLLMPLKRIAQVARNLGEAEDPVRRALLGFFEHTASWLEMLAGQLSTDTLEASRESLCRYASFVSAMKQQDRPISDLLEDAAAVLR